MNNSFEPRRINEVSGELIDVQPSAGGISLGLVYYVIFRRKWMILAIATIGFVAATIYYLSYPAVYKSEAKLFVRYVLEAKTLSPVGSDPNIKSPDGQGSSIINSEMEILSSFDLAEQVAEKIGPEKIMAKAGGGKDRSVAAGLIRKNLLIEAAKGTSVIRLVFGHPDPELANTILAEIISQYLKKHVEIHRDLGQFDEFLTQETDQLRSRLAQTEEEISKIKERSGIISLEDSKKAYTEQISKVRQDFFNAEAELVQRQASLNALNKLIAVPGPQKTNDVPSFKLAEYQRVCARLERLLKQQLELLSQFTQENSRVKDVGRRVNELEEEKEKLEKENPLLASSAAAVNGVAQGINPADEPVRIAALEAKIKVFGLQLEKIRKEAASLDGVEGTIIDLQRKKELEEVQYRYYSSKLEQSRIDEALGLGKVANVSTIQSPSPSYKDFGKRDKTFAGIVAAAILGGIALAFLRELYLNPSVKRASEIEAKLNLPLLLSIPDHRQERIFPKFPALKAPGDKNGDHSADIAPQSPSHLRPYSDGLRDRVVTYFEANNLTHNPKLIALTGCAKNVGVTTIAAGLAASLSETGDGNVLLVDMSVNGGTARHFFKGKTEFGLDELLDSDNRDQALVQENLYVVTEGARGEKLQRILPKRFNLLLPKLKASDYDYIIFDLPPISQTSETARLASFMDMVVLVVESEKTNQEAVNQAMRLLGPSRSKVNAVLNKTKDRVPKWLNHEV